MDQRQHDYFGGHPSRYKPSEQQQSNLNQQPQHQHQHHQHQQHSPPFSIPTWSSSSSSSAPRPSPSLQSSSQHISHHQPQPYPPSTSPPSHAQLQSRSGLPQPFVASSLAHQQQHHHAPPLPASAPRLSVVAFLEALDLKEYISTFLNEGFDRIESLMDVQEDDFAAMGVKRGHRRIIQRELATLRGVPSTTPLNISGREGVAGDDDEGSGRESVQQTNHNTFYLSGNSKSNTPTQDHSSAHAIASSSRNVPSNSPPLPQDLSTSATPVASSVNALRTNNFQQQHQKSTQNSASESGGKRRYRRHPKPDPSAPEKPPSAYVEFSNTIREELKGAGKSFTEIARIVGEQWQMLGKEEKERLESNAAQAKLRYSTQLVEYKKTAEYAAYQEYLEDFRRKHPISSQPSYTPGIAGVVGRDLPNSNPAATPPTLHSRSSGEDSNAEMDGGSYEHHGHDERYRAASSPAPSEDDSYGSRKKQRVGSSNGDWEENHRHSRLSLDDGGSVDGEPRQAIAGRHGQGLTTPWSSEGHTPTGGPRHIDGDGTSGTTGGRRSSPAERELLHPPGNAQHKQESQQEQMERDAAAALQLVAASSAPGVISTMLATSDLRSSVRPSLPFNDPPG
ncbi:hypothetical protein T439DRAFT_322578 [Meredithblackwellia eburnea MCA 4105]